MKNKLLVILIPIVLTIGLFASITLSDDVPIMTKEQLNGCLEILI